MKKSKLAMLAVGVLACASMMAFAACGNNEEANGGDGDKVPAGAKTYTFEAEGCNLSGLAGHGYSDNMEEYQMIFGENRKEIRSNSTVLNSLSNKYFIAYYNNPGTTLSFNINADAASTENSLKLRLGSQFGTLKINPNVLEIKVNDVALNYSEISVTGSAVKEVATDAKYKTAFKDYTISEKFNLKQGENTVTLTLLDNELGAFMNTEALLCVGPGVDCIKITSTATLTWESLWAENKEYIDVEE